METFSSVFFLPLIHLRKPSRVQNTMAAHWRRKVNKKRIAKNRWNVVTRNNSKNNRKIEEVLLKQDIKEIHTFSGAGERGERCRSQPGNVWSRSEAKGQVARYRFKYIMI